MKEESWESDFVGVCGITTVVCHEPVEETGLVITESSSSPQWRPDEDDDLQRKEGGVVKRLHHIR